MGVKHHKAALSAFRWVQAQHKFDVELYLRTSTLTNNNLHCRKASELEPADESLAFFAAAAEQSLQQTQQQKYSSSLS